MNFIGCLAIVLMIALGAGGDVWAHDPKNRGENGCSRSVSKPHREVVVDSELRERILEEGWGRVVDHTVDGDPIIESDFRILGADKRGAITGYEDGDRPLYYGEQEAKYSGYDFDRIVSEYRPPHKKKEWDGWN